MLLYTLIFCSLSTIFFLHFAKFIVDEFIFFYIFSVFCIVVRRAAWSQGSINNTMNDAIRNKQLLSRRNKSDPENM